MAVLQHLGNQQIDEVIRSAAERQVPATVTVRGQKGWVNLRSRVLDIREGHLWLEFPTSENGSPPHEFSPADKAGVSFKLKHHKHVFTGTVAASDQTQAEDGSPIGVLRVCCPTKMHRLQRRAFIRVDVPDNRVVRASYWSGGCEAEPDPPSALQPIWFGRVSNLSAGGFQVIGDEQALAVLDVGETVGVRIIFGAGGETVYADAQFRHVQQTEGQKLLGFQFVGLAQTTPGREALQLIGSKVAEYQRGADGRPRGR